MTRETRAVSLEVLAARIGARVDGDPAFEVHRPASLDRACASDISFYSDRRRLDDLAATRAGAIILSRADRLLFHGPCLIADDPYRAFVAACRVLVGEHRGANGVVDPSAAVEHTARLGDAVTIGPNAVVEAGAILDARVVVGATSYIGAGARIGADSVIAAGVRIYPGCTIGRRCRIESGAVIGAPGFGYLPSDDGWAEVPQIGSVVIGDDVDIGANTTIDRGALDDTVIGDGAKLDNQIQVAHNVVIGEHTAIAGCTGVAGSARIGRRCRIGGRASILGHLTIADDVTIHATSVVTRSITRPGSYASNLTVQPAARWRRILARLARIDELFARVRALERDAGPTRDQD